MWVSGKPTQSETCKASKGVKIKLCTKSLNLLFVLFFWQLWNIYLSQRNFKKMLACCNWKTPVCECFIIFDNAGTENEVKNGIRKKKSNKMLSNSYQQFIVVKLGCNNPNNGTQQSLISLFYPLLHAWIIYQRKHFWIYLRINWSELFLRQFIVNEWFLLKRCVRSTALIFPFFAEGFTNDL